MSSHSERSPSFLSSLLLGGFGLAILGLIFGTIWLAWKLTNVPEAPYQRVVKKEGETVTKPAPAPAPTPAPTPAPAPAGPVAPASDQEPVPVSVALGEQLYQANCLACHQAEGKGKVGFAPYIRNPHFLAMTPDSFIKATITQGRPGTAMVPWAHLKPGEIDSVVAYLRSAADPNLKPPATIDPARKHAGTAETGGVLYGQYCAACHGANASGYAEGGPGPAIGNPGFLGLASDDYIFHTVKHGRAGTAMRPFSGSRGLANLSDQEIGDIIAYLRNRGDAPVIASTGTDSQRGKIHFDANCAACHQPNGTGRPGMAPSIGNRDFLALADDDFIKNTVRKGRPGTAMVQRPDLSDQILDDIVAYLRSLPVENVVKVDVDHSKELASLGDHASGQNKFGLYCAACHGPAGQGYATGGAGPGIGLSGFLDSASDDFIFQTLKQGRIRTAMRPFLGARGLVNLSEQDAYDIIAYMRSLSPSGQGAALQSSNTSSE